MSALHLSEMRKGKYTRNISKEEVNINSHIYDSKEHIFYLALNDPDFRQFFDLLNKEATKVGQGERWNVAFEKIEQDPEKMQRINQILIEIDSTKQYSKGIYKKQLDESMSQFTEGVEWYYNKLLPQRLMYRENKLANLLRENKELSNEENEIYTNSQSELEGK